MRFKTLPEWLQWQENLHFTEVDPGLARIGQVWQQLKGKQDLPFTVITVAGTNGKGSSVAMLEAILRSAGYKTGTYTSPHLLRYNERICIDNQPCEDAIICQTFEQIDQARATTSLTYFEFATLAAIDIFCQQQIDIAILEVGMGGRLDAVNLFDADIALITPIGLDHTAWLGTTREQIAFEKAGVMRTDHPVVSSESSPAQSMIDHALSLKAPFYHAGRDFQSTINSQHWHWSNSDTQWQDLPMPALAGSYQLQNATAVLQVIALLNDMGKPVSESAIRQGFTTVKLAGRFQLLDGPVQRIFDVTHNQQGADNLVNLLSEHACTGKTRAVIAMLKDKDVDAVVSSLKNSIDIWYGAGLNDQRGMAAADLNEKLLKQIDDDDVISKITVAEAYEQAMKDAVEGDRLLIFGSFHTIEAVMRHIDLH